MTIISINTNSSLVSIVRYNVETLELDIILRGGRAYRYSDVGFDIFDELEHSESVGVFYNDNIRGVFDYVEFDYIGTSFVPSNTHVFNSEWLHTAQYDSNTGECLITLLNGAVYLVDMSRQCFNEFISSESAGRYYNDFIRNHAVHV